MSKVPVDRELLERVTALLEWDGMDDTTPLEFGAKCDSLCKELSDCIAQPAEAEGAVEMGSDAWMALHLLDRLSVDSSDELRVMQIEGIVKSMGAALSAVTAERDRLESMLIRTATRHFALQIKDRADDKKLDECLSEGIAMLEAERDQYRAEVERYVPLHEAIQRAAGELPEGWEIQLCIERDGGGVELIGPDGTEDFATNNERLDYTVIDALEAAIAAKEA